MQKQGIKINRKIKIQAELKRLKKEFAEVKLERNIECPGCVQAGISVKISIINNIYPASSKGYVRDS